VLPTALWMRDDRLGGHEQLAVVLETLAGLNRLDEALAEKAEAVRLWCEAVRLASDIQWPPGPTGEFVRVSAEYGLRLFTIVHHGWQVMIEGLRCDRRGSHDSDELRNAIDCYEKAWREYHELRRFPDCPSFYEGRYFSLPGCPDVPGLDATVKHYKNLSCV
jgi:hypothetical protein